MMGLSFSLCTFAQDDWQLVWSDEFNADGPLNSSVWNFEQRAQELVRQKQETERQLEAKRQALLLFHRLMAPWSSCFMSLFAGSNRNKSSWKNARSNRQSTPHRLRQLDSEYDFSAFRWHITRDTLTQPCMMYKPGPGTCLCVWAVVQQAERGATSTWNTRAVLGERAGRVHVHTRLDFGE